MRFPLLGLLAILLIGCNSEPTYDERAKAVANEMAKRLQGIDRSKPPPTPDPPGPEQPDIDKALRLSKTITALGTEDLVVGSGRLAARGTEVHLRYRGELPDGYVFDTNRKPGTRILSFVIGDGSVVPGFEKGVEGMKVGGKRKITIPASLGYGADPPPGSNIPPNCAIIFYVDLLFVAVPEE